MSLIFVIRVILCTATTAANNAVTAANTANTAANSAVSSANIANGKFCYLGNSYFNGWSACPYGGIYRGGVAIENGKQVAGIAGQNVWKTATYHWLCCT